MAGMESNEPKNRVSQGNEAFNPISGLAWGAGVGAVGSGAYIGQAYMSHKTIPKRIEKAGMKATNELDKATLFTKESPNYEKHMEKSKKQLEKVASLGQKQTNNRYLKLGGGWKKTGIVAASAVAGGLIGSASGYASENWIDD